MEGKIMSHSKKIRKAYIQWLSECGYYRLRKDELDQAAQESYDELKMEG
jgi:hypothetical protein